MKKKELGKWLDRIQVYKPESDKEGRSYGWQQDTPSLSSFPNGEKVDFTKWTKEEVDRECDP